MITHLVLILPYYNWLGIVEPSWKLLNCSLPSLWASMQTYFPFLSKCDFFIYRFLQCYQECNLISSTCSKCDYLGWVLGMLVSVQLQVALWVKRRFKEKVSETMARFCDHNESPYLRRTSHKIYLLFDRDSLIDSVICKYFKE